MRAARAAELAQIFTQSHYDINANFITTTHTMHCKIKVYQSHARLDDLIVQVKLFVLCCSLPRHNDHTSPANMIEDWSDESEDCL